MKCPACSGRGTNVKGMKCQFCEDGVRVGLLAETIEDHAHSCICDICGVSEISQEEFVGLQERVMRHIVYLNAKADRYKELGMEACKLGKDGWRTADTYARAPNENPKELVSFKMLGVIEVEISK